MQDMMACSQKDLWLHMTYVFAKVLEISASRVYIVSCYFKYWVQVTDNKIKGVRGGFNVINAIEVEP